MKYLIILMLVSTTVFAKDMDKKKERILKGLNERKALIEKEISCVEDASEMKAIRECRKSIQKERRSKMQERRKNRKTRRQ